MKAGRDVGQQALNHTTLRVEEGKAWRMERIGLHLPSPNMICSSVAVFPDPLAPARKACLAICDQGMRIAFPSAPEKFDQPSRMPIDVGGGGQNKSVIGCDKWK